MKFLAIILVTLISKVSAYPTGADACPAGEAAPGGPHLTGSPGLVGELSEGNYLVTVGGVPVSFDGNPIEVPLDFDIQVSAQGTGFQGILIRVGGTTTDQVTSSDLTAPAKACADIGSVTHSEPSAKTVGTASVSLDAATTLDIDISVVMEFTGEVSTFYYSSFQLNAVDDTTQTGVEENPVEPAMPTSEPTPATAETPSEEEQPVDGQTPSEEDKPAKEDKPIEEEPVNAEDTPTEEEPPREDEEEEQPIAEETPTEEDAPNEDEENSEEVGTSSVPASSTFTISSAAPALAGIFTLLF